MSAVFPRPPNVEMNSTDAQLTGFGGWSVLAQMTARLGLPGRCRRCRSSSVLVARATRGRIGASSPRWRRATAHCRIWTCCGRTGSATAAGSAPRGLGPASWRTSGTHRRGPTRHAAAGGALVGPGWCRRPPASLIEGGHRGRSGACAPKYGDHLPGVPAIADLRRLGLDLHRATLADWVGNASFDLRPVVDCLAADQDVGEARGGRDHDPGSRPGPRQDEDGLSCGRWCATERPWRARTRRALSIAMRRAAAASMARSFSRVFSGTAQIAAIPGTTGWAGRTGRAGR